MFYHLLTQHGTVISISTVQIVKNLELATSNMTEIYRSFYAKIHEVLKLVDRDYVGNNPSPEYWSGIMDEDKDFYEEFQQVYNDRNIPEADESTP